ncbi:MAG: hypothetical protein L0Y39_08080 [Methylococcaceae bacterium]|nr:hypothetical protein [Methylococcaceae bacterium]
MSDWLECHWRKETCSGRRYYRVLIHQDLFGQWNLTRVRGGSLRQAGQVRQPILESSAEGTRVLEEIPSAGKLMAIGLCKYWTMKTAH